VAGKAAVAGEAMRAAEHAPRAWLTSALVIGSRAVLGLEVFFLAGFVALVAGGWGAYRSILPIVPHPSDVEDYEPKTATILYAADGEEIARVFDEDREMVDLADVPERLKQATIAIEDKRFFEHRGLDHRRLVKAVELELTSGGRTQGGSTITMQLAREIYLSKRKSFGRKIQEIALALEIERRFSKDEILEMYLNQVCYGDGAYGCKAAARRFFQKDLSELTLSEVALLAALPNNPQGLSPYDHPREAKVRRDLVLTEMGNQGKVGAGEAAAAQKESLGVKPRSVRGLLSFRAPYFTEYALQELIKRFTRDRVYGGGLRVYTTLNLDAQSKAQEYVAQGVADHRGARVQQGACVIMEPTTGHIVAMVGGIGWSESDMYNRAVLAERQPGSSIKPFVWTAALEHGLRPDTAVSGAPAAFDIGGGLVWTPRNSGGGGGMYTLASALRASVNLVSARLTMSMGPEAVVRTAKKLGIRTNIRPFPSIALGSEGVTVLDMTTAYCCFANGGYRVEPTCIDKVYDHNGILIDEGEPVREQVIDQRIAYEMNQMMQGVVSGGTGRQAQGLPAPTAGKTGTTDRSCDAWFIGFTPKLACGVWVGNDENNPMGGVFGGNVPCPIWRRIMGMALDVLGKQGGEFPGPGHALASDRKPTMKLISGRPAADEEKKPQVSGGGGRGAPRDLFN